MSIAQVLLFIGVPLVLGGVILNTRHYLKLDEDQRNLLRKKGGAPKWALLVHLFFGVLIGWVETWQATVVLLIVFALEVAYFAKVQYGRLKSLDFPERWLREKRWIDGLFAVALIFVFGSLLYPRFVNI